MCKQEWEFQVTKKKNEKNAKTSKDRWETKEKKTSQSVLCQSQRLSKKWKINGRFGLKMTAEV